jgi:hypothetical protein
MIIKRIFKINLASNKLKIAYIFTFILVAVSFIGHGKSFAITVNNQNYYPNQTTASFGVPSGSNNSSSIASDTGALNFVDAKGTVTGNYYLYSKTDNKITYQGKNSATRALGAVDNYASYEVFIPSGLTYPSTVTVTIVDACKLINDDYGWEDANVYPVSTSATSAISAYYLLTNPNPGQSGALAYNDPSGQTYCSGSSTNLNVNIPIASFQPDARYGNNYSTAIVEVEMNSRDQDMEKNFSVESPYGTSIFPMTNSPVPGATSSGSTTYNRLEPDALTNPTQGSQSQDVVNLSNPSANNYYTLGNQHDPNQWCDLPLGGSNVNDCYSGENGGFLPLDTPANDSVDQCTVYVCKPNNQIPPNEDTPFNDGSPQSYTNNKNASNTFNFWFTPDCSYTTGQHIYLKWYRGAGQQGVDQVDQESFSLLDNGNPISLLDNGNPIMAVNPSTYDGGNKNGYEWIETPVLNIGDSYDWQWSNVDKAHGITVVVPFSEFTDANGNFSYSQDCNYSLQSHTIVDTSPIVAGQTATFTNWIHNSGPNNATSFNWQVQGEYIDSNGTSNGWGDTHCGNNPYGGEANYKSIVSQTGPPTSCLGGTLSGAGNDNITYGRASPPSCNSGNAAYSSTSNTDCKYETYEFPPNAVPGDQYCIRITYTTNTSPVESSNPNDTGACVTYRAVTTLYGACNYASYNTGTPYPGDSGVRYALFESPNTGIPGYYTGENVAGSSAHSFPNIAAGSIHSNDAAAANTVYTYDLTPQQVTSGTVAWFLATYNDVTIGGRDYAHINNVYGTPPITNCNQATCTITLNNTTSLAPYGNQDVLGGQPLSYTVNIYNSGSNTLENPITTQNPTYPLSGTSYIQDETTNTTYVGFAAHGLPATSIPVGQTASTDPIAFNSSTQPDEFTIAAYPAYDGENPYYYIGPECTSTFDVYEPFNMTGSTSLNLVNTATGQTSTEDANQADMSFTTTNGQPYPAPTTMTMQLCYYQAGSYNTSTNPAQLTSCSGGALIYNQADSGDVPPNLQENPTYPINQQLGDVYCSYVEVHWQQGYVGPGGGEIGTSDPHSFDGSCQREQNEPYIHVFGNDAQAGGAFGANESCTPASIVAGGIYGFSHASDSTIDDNQQQVGSGSQLGAIADSLSQGFSSADLRASYVPTGGMGLTFANIPYSVAGVNSTTGSSTVGAGPDTANLGGAYGSGNCTDDYYSNISTVSSPNGNPSAFNLRGGGTVIYSVDTPSVTTQIGDGSPISIPDKSNITVYVNGNVYINSNIIYTNSGSWSDITNIPSLYLIVKGNIYIDPSVTTLDGVYIAEPTSPTTTTTTGTIDTCASSNGAYSLDELAGDALGPDASTWEAGAPGCDRQLEFNGAVVAQNLELDRTYSSLRYAVAGEDINNISGSHPCGTPGLDVNASDANAVDCAAEIFNFSPEVYLTTPGLQATSGPSSGKFDEIESLPPVL